MEFKKKEFDKFRADVEEALKEVGKKYEVAIEGGNISYSEEKGTFSLKLDVKRADIDVDLKSFETGLKYDCYLRKGFTMDDYKKSVIIDGKEYTITGLKPSCKYNVILTRSDGKLYCFTHNSVLQALGREVV